MVQGTSREIGPRSTKEQLPLYQEIEVSSKIVSQVNAGKPTRQAMERWRDPRIRMMLAQIFEE